MGDDNASMFGWITAHPYAYPLLEVAHIAGIALLLGNLVLFELRVWGFGTALPAPALARLALPLSALGFGLAAATGLIMFLTQSADLLANRVFVVKMGLVMLAGCNAGIFHARGGPERLDGTARALTALSLGLWIAVIGCGRWIAYV